ncbi:type II toxin-antitoxin system VapC family toxin [Candidatus Woesearchaeota archaeon]|nr:type II toxin-antitoxin system VapC family toxin [Candidatus Woesearchaeota archaeon]
MKYKVFLDSNIFIYGFEYEKSNSALVIKAINDDKIEPIVSERVIKEVTRYFEKFHSLELARKIRRYILETCTVISGSFVIAEIERLRNSIKEKDAEQVAVVKKLGIKYLIALDRDFEPFDEYIIPKDFIAILGNKAFSTEY